MWSGGLRLQVAASCSPGLFDLLPDLSGQRYGKVSANELAGFEEVKDTLTSLPALEVDSQLWHQSMCVGDRRVLAIRLV